VSKVVKTVQFGDRKLVLETGEVARQAHGAVLASMDGTQVLVTVVAKKSAATNDSLPLMVLYQEKYYAAGKIPGSFGKREGRLSEDETLKSRLIDRSIRPLFPDDFHDEVQVIATVVSLNPDVPADMVALIGASAALSISGLPISYPIASARVGYKDGVYLLNPDLAAAQTSDLDLVVAGSSDAVFMVESEASELSEDIMLGAILFGQASFQTIIQAIMQLAQEASRTPWVWQPDVIPAEVTARLEELALQELSHAYLIKDKTQRYETLDKIRQHTADTILAEVDSLSAGKVFNLLSNLESKIVRERILSGEARIDGRDNVTVRPITAKIEFLSRAHGSALFTRGDTQALAVATLGNKRNAQILDGLVGNETLDWFMLHYNFPPYSVGEVGHMAGPKRREIGHGRLARRALTAVLPSIQEFPYVIRVVSEITESCGSSSMATVCGSSLALMDAGVPIKAPVAGVAMGLIKEGDRFAILTDILGDEDHLGDMDFKVAGTAHGVTALQMDIKISGIPKEVMEQALSQANAGRKHILGIMNNVLSAPKENLSVHAPRIATMKVHEDKIRTVIGKGGATIKGLIESTGVAIDIDDTGLIQMFSSDAAALLEAEKQIKALVADVEVGQTYHGRVSKIMDFGAFINLLPGKDGLLHISQICSDRTQKVEDVLNEGQEIEVFVAGVDKQGKIKLEWKDKPVAATEVME
jgi:polyribonucleotide nucleotidyltransferase